MRLERIITAALIAGWACGLALGQDALGDGRALDNSLSTESRYNLARPSLAQEFRFRNAIVTGNAPNGMSFRGDIGYRAPGEFTGQLGSNDLYAFRRDSLSSGLAGMGIRGTEALQMQFALTTGGRPPQNLMGSFALPRAGGNALPTPGLNDPVGSDGTIYRAPDPYEPDDSSLASLRAPSSFEANRGYRPVLLAWEPLQPGQDWYGLTASELRGVVRSELEPPEPPAGRLDTSVAPERFETSYTALMDRLLTESQSVPPPATEEGDTRPAWRIRLEELQKDLLLQQTEPQEPTQAPAPGEGSEQPAGGEAGSIPGQPDAPIFDPQTIDVLRSHGERSRDFVPPDVLGVYAEHMRLGQKYFEEGRYFDAEERFAHALTIRPNDVAAQAARIHAQIGAGMYLSAALNLRTLILENPAVVSARYDAALMPSPERLVDVVAALREGTAAAQRETPAGSALRRARASGLLLAYIGFQTDDMKMVDEGVNAARSAIAKSADTPGGTENTSELRLLDLIEAVWANRQAP